MKTPRLSFAIVTTVSALLSFPPAAAQILPPLGKPARVQITKAPELELAMEHLTIIRWTTNNPGGSDVHYGVVHYGTDRRDLSQSAKSPIRINHGQPFTTFRVRINDLEPQTRYYYTVTSEESGGTNDGVNSPVATFTTPGPGERIPGETKRD
jgi:hypothetical protein